ncbi:WW domain-binding protein 11 [Drosophila tropicalis]|uniref:WW domain-binding protein 11 n=1 Tax=Drosophila tropicalis TaxID=46794 RepID=UPI0035ABEEA8
MGRRSINTTKSGKYMNPTDQARKEARKKELKKNKRQRQMVRAAVLKNKDPSQILEEMEKIDEMEYNVLQPSPLNEKVLRDKRKKLKETFDRVMRLYHNDEPEHWAELKRKEVEYEKKRLKKQQYYESVKHAQSVQIDEIPLPAPVTPGTSGPSSVGGVGSNAGTSAPGFAAPGGVGGATGIRLPPPPMTMALPPFAPGAPPGVTAKNIEAAAAAAGGGGGGASESQHSSDKSKDDDDKDWRGVPPGPPPDLFAMTELDSDAEGNTDYEPDEEELAQKQKEETEPIGQNIDEFMKEMEHVHKRKHRKLQKEQQEKSDEKKKDTKGGSGTDSKSNSASDSDDDYDDDDDDETNVNDDDAHDNNHDADVDMPEAKSQSSSSASSKAMPSLPAAHQLTAPSVLAPPTAPPALPTIPLPPTNTVTTTSVPAPPQLSQLPPQLHNIAPPPPGIMFRPPPMRPPHHGPGSGFGLRMPRGPPPGSRPPHALGPMPRMGIRMPPGPPPGLPPRMAHHNKQGGGGPVGPGGPGGGPIAPKDSAKGVTTITAKPQIRNLSADVTRFVPSTLRVKRDDQRHRISRPKHAAGAGPDHHSHNPNEAHSKPPTKDDAYLQFMNEMQGLL